LGFEQEARVNEMEVIRLAQKGDTGAFEQLYRHQTGRVYALCLRIAGNRSRAEELIQEVFMHVWEILECECLEERQRFSLCAGDITIRGIAKRITIPVKVTGVAFAGSEIGQIAGFESEFVINREDFGVAKGWDVIGKDVTINLLVGASSK
jgi:hypothetical protein